MRVSCPFRFRAMNASLNMSELLARRDRAMGAGAELFYTDPIDLVRGDGAHLFDSEGRRYIDFYNNVPAVGHGNARVADAISLQQRTLNTHSRYVHENVIRYAERLAALHAPAIDSIVFSCSGTEANEVGIQMARIATGKRGIVCTDSAYHGNSDLVGRLTGVGHVQPESPDVHAFPFPDFYRPAVTGHSQEELAEQYLARISDAIVRFERSGVGFAGILNCSIFANEGLPTLPASFMQRVVDLVHKAGGLVIADEVQAGFGRTGHWWGYQASGYTPDIVVMGKPMGNGVPLSGTGASRALVDAFRAKTDHFNTTASSPLQAAAGLAVLDELEDRDLLARARAMAEILRPGLERIAAEHPNLGEIRGRGLFFVAEVVTDKTSRVPDPALATRISDRLKDLGYLTATAGPFKNLVKIRPPLVILEEDIRAFLAAFESVTAELECAQ
jgi:4-aminobutyrate aminotransferase-like enzyme